MGRLSTTECTYLPTSRPRRCRPDRPAGPTGHDRAPPAARSQPTARGHALHPPGRGRSRSRRPQARPHHSPTRVHHLLLILPAALIVKATAKVKAAAARTDPPTPTQATQAPWQRTGKTPDPTSAPSHLRTEVLLNLEPDRKPKPDPKPKPAPKRAHTTPHTQQHKPK